MIVRGQADVDPGGRDGGPIIELILAGFCAMRGLVAEDVDPTLAMRPFDATRAGFVMGEGACILVLEEMEAARARGARIYAEVLGYGASNDAHHLAQPEPEATGVAAMISSALAAAGVAPEQVGYVNAHGTSTPLGDLAETRALKPGVREARVRARGVLDEVGDGALLRCRGGGRGDDVRAGAAPPAAAADDQLPEPGSRARPRLRPERGARGRARGRALERDGPRRPQRLRAAGPRRSSPRRRGDRLQPVAGDPPRISSSDLPERGDDDVRERESLPSGG